MKQNKFITYLFSIAGIYDGILGLSFLLIPRMVFDYFKVEYPNHFGYIHFPAMILLIFSIMFFNIVSNPIANKNLIFYSILFKVSYAAVVLAYWFGSSIPDMWKPFAICDLAFAVLFYYAYKKLSTTK